MKDGVSIVIPTWNGLELLKQFLPSVIQAAKFHCNPTEIIIVDDGSDDETLAWLTGEGFADVSETGSSATQQPALKLIRNKTNRGFGETCNRGIEAALYPLIFLLNNDVEVARDSIAPLVENFADADVFSAHCHVFNFESGQECGTGKLGSFSQGFIRVHRSYVALIEGELNSRGRALYSMFASGGSAMFDRQKFLELGGFDCLLSPAYWEDVDISYRAWKRGYKILYEPRSVVRHRISSTMRRVNQRKMRRIQQRNRIIYHWINLHDRKFFLSHLLWVTLLALTSPLRFQMGYLLSVFSALKRLPQIRKRRREERASAKRSDRDLYAIFATFEQRADILPYDERKRP
ncbi:MAG: glycosyltransferase family 2 protein [Blastocatellia bacterium]